MITTKNRIFIALLFVGISSHLVCAQDKKLIDYPRKEAIALLEAGGSELIKKHGEEMLEFIYLTEIPTDEELFEETSSPNKEMRRKKQDLPVFKALKSNGEASLELIRNTHYFKYPQPFSDLEVIAFFLLDLKSKDEALRFARDQMAGQYGYEKENWQTIMTLINNDDLSKGNFLYEKKLDFRAEMNRMDMLRPQMKKQVNDMQVPEQNRFFANHYRFQKILEALLKYYSTEKVWPGSLYLLAEKKLIEMPEISFMDADGFAHIPMLLGQLKDGKETQKVLWLQIPDAKYILEGSLNGDIKIIPSQSK
jgi:hypothetical protein